MEIAWQVEIDPWCRKVLAKHWPDVPKFEDVCKVGSHNLEPVDLICGGFPCQDISNAGKRAGIEGERSGLWSEYARIIRELRPRYVIVENVAALLARGIDVVLRDLAESGYNAEWDIISAAAVGAPHRRERVWIVAYPKGERQRSGLQRRGVKLDGTEEGGNSSQCSEERSLADANGERPALTGESNAGQGSIAGRHSAGGGSSAVPHPFQSGLEGNVCEVVAGTSQGRYDADAARPGWWAIEPDVGRVAHGVPKRGDRLRGLGNAVVPQVVEWIGHRIMADSESSS